MAKWANRTYPDGCRHCGTTERRSLGRGLCSRCYQDASVRELYEPIRGGDVGAMENDTDNATDTNSSDEAYLVPGDDGGNTLGAGALLEEVAPLTSERAPGSAPSPSPEAGAAPGPATPPSKGWRARFARKRETDEPEVEVRTPKRPKTHLGRRVSAADSLADVWAGLGSLAIRSGHVPTGRLVQFQSQVAGEMLDEALKGSPIDRRVLQPIVKGRSRFDLVSAVIAPPLLVLAMERNPAQAEVLLPMLRSQLRASLPLMLPAIKKVEERNRKAAEAAAELFPDLPDGADPVDELVAMIFGDWAPPAPEPEATEPEPNPAQPEETFI